MRFDSASILDDSFPSEVKIRSLKIDSYCEEPSISQISELEMLGDSGFGKLLEGDEEKLVGEVNLQAEMLNFKIKKNEKRVSLGDSDSDEGELKSIQNILVKKSEFPKKENFNEKTKIEIKKLKNELKKKYLKNEIIVDYDLDFNYKALIDKTEAVYNKDIERMTIKIEKEYQKYIKGNRNSEIQIIDQGIQKTVGIWDKKSLKMLYGKTTAEHDIRNSLNNSTDHYTRFEILQLLTLGPFGNDGLLYGIGLKRKTYLIKNKPVMIIEEIGRFVSAVMIEGIYRTIRLTKKPDSGQHFHVTKITISGGSNKYFFDTLGTNQFSPIHPDIERFLINKESYSVVNLLRSIDIRTKTSNFNCVPDTKKTPISTNEYLVLEYELKKQSDLHDLSFDNIVKSTKPKYIAHVLYKPDKTYHYERYDLHGINEKIYYYSSKEKKVEVELKIDCNDLSYSHTKVYDCEKPSKYSVEDDKLLLKNPTEIMKLSGVDINLEALQPIKYCIDDYKTIEFVVVSFKNEPEQVYLDLRKKSFQIEYRKIKGNFDPSDYKMMGIAEYVFKDCKLIQI